MHVFRHRHVFVHMIHHRTASLLLSKNVTRRAAFYFNLFSLHVLHYVVQPQNRHFNYKKGERHEVD